mmetsp:Transcript_13054/g.12897  ORF Transcript_13054/g.12897 Transcript_13054/m.12897 type:complete len:83 (-) Transcript_13054:312-560(-)
MKLSKKTSSSPQSEAADDDDSSNERHSNIEDLKLPLFDAGESVLVLGVNTAPLSADSSMHSFVVDSSLLLFSQGLSTGIVAC